jgi:hypothetical protein
VGSLAQRSNGSSDCQTVLVIAYHQYNDSCPIKHDNKPAVMKTIMMMRDQSIMADRANMASDSGIVELIASLSDIESSINAAVAEMNCANNPEQKAHAERQVIALMERKLQLELQLARARQRQINMAIKTVRVSGVSHVSAADWTLPQEQWSTIAWCFLFSVH